MQVIYTLVVLYLGGEVPGFRFRQPGDTSEARWMVDLIYNLEIILNSKFLDISKEMIEQSTLASEFVAFFDALFFLQAPIASKAPVNDLQAVKFSLQLQTSPSLKNILK